MYESDEQGAGTVPAPNTALALAAAPHAYAPYSNAFASASAIPELQQFAHMMVKYDHNVHLSKPGPDQATCEKLRLRNELRLLKHSNNPEAVRYWWRHIYKEKNIAKLAHHNGQPQLDGKILDEVYPMLPTDLRRDIDQQSTKLHRDSLPTLNGQQTLRIFRNTEAEEVNAGSLHSLEETWSL